MKVRILGRYLVIERIDYTDTLVKFNTCVNIRTNLFGRHRELSIFKRYKSYDEYACKYIAWLINTGDLRFVKNDKYHQNIKKYIKYNP